MAGGTPRKKRQRNYAAEYARRIARAKEKADEAGEEFDLAKARGHVSKQVERQRLRAQNGHRWSEGTLTKLHNSMLATDHALERLVEAMNEGLSIEEVKTLIHMQNETYRAYHRGVDMDQVHRLMAVCVWKAEDFGIYDSTWYYYH